MNISEKEEKEIEISNSELEQPLTLQVLIKFILKKKKFKFIILYI